MTNQWFEANRLERRWSAIRRALTHRGTNLTQLADTNQLSNLRTAARRSFPAAEAVIAETLQVTVEALFPERYGIRWS
ncbi:helix-turn-helix domain-containing protein [Pseudomonas oryzihabitans]|nr:helix-turn-helix domain-containing protein [Pseudomonas oryzihabitans]